MVYYRVILEVTEVFPLKNSIFRFKIIVIKAIKIVILPVIFSY